MRCIPDVTSTSLSFVISNVLFFTANNQYMFTYMFALPPPNAKYVSQNKVLDEIANAQMVMCESLEMSLSQTLEAFAGAEFQEAHRLRDEADVLTEAAEESLAKYLHGRHQERSNTEDQISKAMQVASNQFGAALKGFAAARSASGVGGGGATSSSDDGDGGGAGGGSSTATTPRPNTPSRKHRAGGLRRSRSSNADEDPTVAHAVAAANLRQNLEQIRLAQANAELKRFQLLKKLDSLKVRLFIDAFLALVHVSFISVSHILTSPRQLLLFFYIDPKEL